jgi:SAM-dependent methyltransferase
VAVKKSPKRTSWDPVAEWYNGWVGKKGSYYHRNLAIPLTLELLNLKPKERLLDVGAGQGVLAPYISRKGAEYVGLELSKALVKLAIKYHGQDGLFLHGDARGLPSHPKLSPNSFDAAVFLLSIQDMDPLEAVIASVGAVLKPGGRLVILMLHPCFRVPRQSGWGFDERRKLTYRRVDSYLRPLAVPMKEHRGGVTRSFHRPLETYFNTLSDAGFGLERLREVPDAPHKNSKRAKEGAVNPDIPLFLALSARKR